MGVVAACDDAVKPVEAHGKEGVDGSSASEGFPYKSASLLEDRGSWALSAHPNRTQSSGVSALCERSHQAAFGDSQLWRSDRPCELHLATGSHGRPCESQRSGFPLVRYWLVQKRAG